MRKVEMADSNADLRQRFEKWVKCHPELLYGNAEPTRDGGSGYVYGPTQIAWMGFQAAQPSSADLEKLAREESLEEISAKVHEQWMESKRLQGISSRKSESGEELMVSYSQLSESAKELDRGSVRAVLSAIKSLQLLTSTLKGDKRQ